MTHVRSFEIPTVMKHGPGAINTLADEVKALEMKRPLIVTDPGIVTAGLLERVAAPLKAANVDYAVFDQVAPNPPIALVDEGAAFYERKGCGGIIGLGLGYALGALIAMMIPSFPPISVPLWASVMALGFSGFVGIVFGILPAAKAANLDPIVALRYE